jgi:hypothetical protein
LVLPDTDMKPGYGTNAQALPGTDLRLGFGTDILVGAAWHRTEVCL